MDTLILPNNITIEFVDKKGVAIQQDNILIGIHTFANNRNDITLSPFISDKYGLINISKQDLLDKANIAYSYGLMDYSSLESAKQNVEIYFWGLAEIQRYFDYYDKYLSSKNYLKQYELYGDKLGKRDIESAMIEKREKDEYDLYKNSVNLKTNIKSNMILIKDIWNGSEMNKKYKIDLSI